MLIAILTLITSLSEGSHIIKKHVPNSVYPNYMETPAYNITSWVSKLNLQRCAIVEIGERFAAVFVESFPENHPPNSFEGVTEYFLGICDLNTLYTWNFCSATLRDVRPASCTFDAYAARAAARVHRRLCDVSQLSFSGKACNCSFIGYQRLYQVYGFPTCFLPPMPQSICEPFNVCGLTSCRLSTEAERIHTVACNPNCLGRQPFCELAADDTSAIPEITSFWSDWSEPMCLDGACLSGEIYREASCINRNTGKGAIDCLGPGTSCCPPDESDCKCRIYEDNGVSKVFKTSVHIPIIFEKRSVRGKRQIAITYPVSRVRHRYNRSNSLFWKGIRKTALQLEKFSFDEEYEDDDLNQEGEDIAIEEDPDKEKPLSTRDSDDIHDDATTTNMTFPDAEANTSPRKQASTSKCSSVTLMWCLPLIFIGFSV